VVVAEINNLNLLQMVLPVAAAAVDLMLTAVTAA
jgi:hypothetical protein